MKTLRRHVSKCFLAGIVALLPVGGLILTVFYAESFIAASLFKDRSFYFPGLGLLGVAVAIYLIGLIITSFFGRWVWSLVDSLLSQVPALGPLYRTLKQILGYGEGEDALFQRVVLIPGRDKNAEEIGLVTRDDTDATGREMLTVFVPGSPNPTTGRLVVIPAAETRPLNMPVAEALKALVSVGKAPIPM